MFTDFFYLLRSYGMKISLLEWQDFLTALEQGFHGSSLTGFYQLGRLILVKKLGDYDRYDRAFLAYFKQIENHEDVMARIRAWLDKTPRRHWLDKATAQYLWGDKSLEEIEKLLEDRLKNQKEEHNGGRHYIGTGGITPFGHSGYAPRGIRIMGQGGSGRALKIAGERHYKDFRDDTVLGVRQFQVALRHLRQLSSKEGGPRTELDVEGTIQATCRQGGQLKIVMKRPRKNQTRVLLMMDWGGSMWAYVDLVRRLFKAVNENMPFKELKIYYFHNLFYDYLFTTSDCNWNNRISTRKVWNACSPDTKVIVVGDAEMAPWELWAVNGNADGWHGNARPGVLWVRDLKKKFPASIWLNPMNQRLWDYRRSTVIDIGKELPMYPLTVQGLEKGIQKLKNE